LYFSAPEVINRKPYDQKVDMWSIGITTYLLLSGETPFNGKNRQQLFRRISCDEPIFPDDKWGNVSDEAIDFVLRLLTKDPAKRMSASEALRHEWIVGSGAKALMNASMATTSEDLSEVTYHSKKSRDPPPQATTNKKSPSANHRPPPPPKLSSRRGDHDADENARLLDVIKEQDAKIEKLEAMVKRMLEPEGVVP
jgi:serine/threonine protein kinase